MPKKTPKRTQIRITDDATIRKVEAAMQAEGDKTAARTACKIIDRYFAMTSHASNLAPA